MLWRYYYFLLLFIILFASSCSWEDVIWSSSAGEKRQRSVRSALLATA